MSVLRRTLEACMSEASQLCMYCLKLYLMLNLHISSHILGLWYPDGIGELARSNQAVQRCIVSIVTLVLFVRLILVLFDSRSKSRARF